MVFIKYFLAPKGEKGRKTNMKKTNTSASAVTASVTNIIDSAFVPDMEANKNREVLGDEVASPRHGWEEELVCQNTSAFDCLSLRERMKLSRKEMNIGRNRVMITKAVYRHNHEGQEMYSLSLVKMTDPDFAGTKEEDNAGARIENLALFPGKRFVDHQGKVHDDGWQWDYFCNLREREYLGCKGKNIEEIFTFLMGHPFDVWLIKDISKGYTQMFLTEKSYNGFIDRMAKKASEEAKKAKKDEQANKKANNDDKPPFDV